MRRFLVVLCGITLPFLTSCSEYTDYVKPAYSVVVEYCNETYSPITIEFVANNHWELGLDLDHGVAIISPGESIMLGGAYVKVPLPLDESDILQDRELDLYAGIYALPIISKVTFAPKYVLSGEVYELSDTSSYQIEYNAFSDDWVYTYTFTDEDYAYAREHGEVVE
mgnify:FL=1